MRVFRVLTLTFAVLVVSTPRVTAAGGHSEMGHSQVFRGPSTRVSAFPPSLRVHRGFGRQLGRQLFGVGANFGGDVAEVGPDVPDDAPVIADGALYGAPPAPPVTVEPKFLLPPPLSAPEPAGSHTVIVQHGSKIEVQSFLPDR